MRALDRKLVRDLRHIWLQALAIALVIGCGVAMYVMSLGTLRSLEETRMAYYERYRFAEIFATAKRAPERLVRRIAEIPGVAAVETRIVAGVTLDIAGTLEPVRGLLVSVPEHHEPVLNGLHYRAGRSISPGGVNEVVLNEPFAEAHGLTPGDSLRAVVNGRMRNLDIVGIALSPEYIYSLAPGAFIPDNKQFGVIWASRGMLSAAYDLEDSFSAVSMTVHRGAVVSDVIAEIDRLLSPYGGTGAYSREDQTSHWYISNELYQLNGMGNVASPLFLGIAAFLLRIVTSRLIEIEREQIGLLKAFGYSSLSVSWHYAKMALAIILVGIVFGFVIGGWLGRGLTELYAEFFRFPFLFYRPDPSVFVLSAMISLVIGMAGAVGAVYRAARLPPAVAMQPASPPLYRKTLLEKLGLTLRLGQAARMIVRNLVRRPFRAVLTCIGIAMSAAILVSTMFMLDTFEVLIDVQYNQIQRQDVTVSLSEPRDADIVREMAGLKGVMMAEPVRVLPVRLRHGHLSHRTAIIGLARDANLGRVVNTDLRVMPMPPDGLVLSTKLAEILDAGRGDMIAVETQEGRRSIRHLNVVAVVEEYLGAAAYMELTALNLVSGDGDVASAVYIQADPLSEAALYGMLKEIPAVAGVTIEKAAVKLLRKHLNEHIGYMVGFNMIFAGLIAFGVVYNSARISLSERARDFASLRVLGFTRVEVSSILLGEFAVLTLLALPLGFLIGYGLAWLITVSFDTELYRIPLVIARRTYGLAAFVVIGSALVTGLIVRRRIDRLDLVAVLKTRE